MKEGIFFCVSEMTWLTFLFLPFWPCPLRGLLLEDVVLASLAHQPCLLSPPSGWEIVLDRKRRTCLTGSVVFHHLITSHRISFPDSKKEMMLITHQKCSLSGAQTFSAQSRTVSIKFFIANIDSIKYLSNNPLAWSEQVNTKSWAFLGHMFSKEGVLTWTTTD